MWKILVSRLKNRCRLVVTADHRLRVVRITCGTIVLAQRTYELIFLLDKAKLTLMQSCTNLIPCNLVTELGIADYVRKDTRHTKIHDDRYQGFAWWIGEMEQLPLSFNLDLLLCSTYAGVNDSAHCHILSVKRRTERKCF
jgi:hypothetical protein